MPSVTTPKASVVVPAYERPDMLRTLIASFLLQDHGNCELVISDDSRTDAVERLVRSIGDPRVVYFRNETNLGYAENFLVALERATGEFIIVLGDDDAFMSPTAISEYAKAFAANPSVGYVYSNQAQFGNSLKVDYVFHTFAASRSFARGEEALARLWLTSIFIAGIGLRADFPFRAHYPSETILFPQVELVGHVLCQRDGFGVAQTLIAGRAHGEQLGFYASKGERIKGGERHGTVELFEIFERLRARYGLAFGAGFIEDELVARYGLMLLKEKLVLGNARMQANYRNFCQVSRKAAASRSMKVGYVVALASPRWLLWCGWKGLQAWRNAKNRDEFQPLSAFLQRLART
jgi:glycosyltransferase involved in cell wall biosynthesis